MKPPVRSGKGKRLWAMGGLALFAALDIVLVGAAYVQGHPHVQGTPGPIATYSAPSLRASPPGTKP